MSRHSSDIDLVLNADRNIVIGDTTWTPTELTALDGVTAGTATASRALVLGASKEIATITSATITTLTSTTTNATTVDTTNIEVTNIKAKDGTAAIVITDSTGAVAVSTPLTAASIAGGDSSLGVDGQSAAQGGAIVITGGTSSTAGNAGGAVSIVGGTPGATSAGGAVTVTTGAGGATSGASGDLTVATGTATAGSGSASGAVILQSGAGAASAAAVVGGASGAVTVRSQAGGANTGGATGEAGGAAGALAVTAGAGGATNSTGAHAGGAGGAISVTAGVGGNASAGTGNGGAGGNVILTPGTGGTSAGGTAGIGGSIINRGVVAKTQADPNAQTTTVTLTVDNLLTGIITGTHAVGGTQTYTLPTGTLTDAGLQFAANDSFDWHLINLSAAAADTITVAAGTDHTLVGDGVVQSSHATTGLLYGASAHFRTRKTAANTYVTYRIA